MSFKLKPFLADTSGNITIKTGMIIGAFALTLSVLAAPVLDNVSQTYADNTAFGIDKMITASVKSKEERYIVRKSVLRRGEERIELSGSK